MRKFEINLDTGEYIRVNIYTKNHAGINSSLIDENRDEHIPEYYAAIDAIESLILAHACAGINVEDPSYVEGITVALESICNEYA